MQIASVGVTGFVNDRKSDIDFLRSLRNISEFQQQPTNKRCIDRLRYRTKSFQPYKLRRICSKKHVTSAKSKSNRRQKRSLNVQNGSVLKSNLWLVKRLFMAKGSKYTIPSHSRKFGFKAVERFAKHRSVIHDMSYFRCILTGSQNILEILAQFIDTQSTLFTLCGSKNYHREVGEVTVEFHRRNKFPSQCIGVVHISYISLQNSSNDTTVPQLSMWMHPSIYDDVMQELITVEEEFQQNEQGSESQGSFSVNCNHLSRICVRGPKAMDALKSLINEDGRENHEPFLSCSAVSSGYLKLLLHYKHMNRLWLPGHVLAVDLQLTSFNGRKPSTSNNASNDSVSLKWPSQGSLSPLWNETVTEETEKQVKNNRSRVTIRSRWLEKQSQTTGSDKNKTSKPSSSGLNLPVVLIRKSIKHTDVRSKLAELSGWDLVLSRAALGPVWRTLIFCGVIPLGSEEMDFLQRGVGALSFPRDYLDSREGQQYWMARREGNQRRNEVRPLRNRRECGDVLVLLSMLQKGSDVADFDVSRDVLSEYPLNRVMIVRGSHYSADFAPPAYVSDQFQSTGASQPAITPLPPLPPLTLLNVTLRMTGRGLPLDLAQLIRPLPSDYTSWLEGCERRKARRQEAGEKSESSMWRGIRLRHYATTEGSYEGRNMIGFVTSGQKPHLNNDTVVIGVCSANLLHRLFIESYGHYPHPQAHFLVLVRNVRSQWLRPALVSIM